MHVHAIRLFSTLALTATAATGCVGGNDVAQQTNELSAFGSTSPTRYRNGVEVVLWSNTNATTGITTAKLTVGSECADSLCSYRKGTEVGSLTFGASERPIAIAGDRLLTFRANTREAVASRLVITRNDANEVTRVALGDNTVVGVIPSGYEPRGLAKARESNLDHLYHNHGGLWLLLHGNNVGGMLWPLEPNGLRTVNTSGAVVQESVTGPAGFAAVDVQQATNGDDHLEILWAHPTTGETQVWIDTRQLAPSSSPKAPAWQREYAFPGAAAACVPRPGVYCAPITLPRARLQAARLVNVTTYDAVASQYHAGQNILARWVGGIVSGYAGDIAQLDPWAQTPTLLHQDRVYQPKAVSGGWQMLGAAQLQYVIQY
jgi:hypothetical protein